MWSYRWLVQLSVDVHAAYVDRVCVEDSMFTFPWQLLNQELEADRPVLCMLHSLSLNAVLATNTFLQWTIQFSIASHVFVDCFLAGAMCYYLQQGRSGFSQYAIFSKDLFFRWPMASRRRSDGIVTKLIQYVVGSGVITACETFLACLLECSIDNALFATGHLLLGRSLL